MATAIKDDDSSLRKSEEREREERERVGENFADFGTALLIIQFCEHRMILIFEQKLPLLNFTQSLNEISFVGTVVFGVLGVR